MDANAFALIAPVCAAAVTGATGATTAKVGPVAIARTGAGVYTWTLAFAINAAQCVMVITTRTSGTYNYVHTSDTVKTVNTFAVDGVTATDKNYDGILYVLPAGQ